MRDRTIRQASVAVLAFAVLAVGCTEDVPPVSVGDSGLTAEAWVVPQEDVARFIEDHGGSMPRYAPLGGRPGREPAAVARVDWTSQDLPDDTRFQVVVLDPSGRDAATIMQVSPPYDRVSIGWDGRYEELATRYPWLEATRSAEDAYGYVEDTMAVAFHPDTEGPLWIVARFSRNSAIGVARPNDVPVVGAFLTSEPDEHIWWAEQLAGA